MRFLRIPLLLAWCFDRCRADSAHKRSRPRSNFFAIAALACSFTGVWMGVLGGVISHSLVGASPDYQAVFSRNFRSTSIRSSTTRRNGHRWRNWRDSSTSCSPASITPDSACGTRAPPTFNVMHTPYKKDILRELVDAFRKQGIAIGIYFSPDDFWWLHQHHIPINRHVKGVYPQDIPAFMDYTKAQLHELLTGYGKIDYFFFDGPAEQLTDYAWSLQPDLVITRGAMETPEQYIAGRALPGAWEGNLTMGTEWPWKPTNETYKSGIELIDTIIETRAKGGNMLLNVGPKPDGTLPLNRNQGFGKSRCGTSSMVKRSRTSSLGNHE